MVDVHVRPLRAPVGDICQEVDQRPLLLGPGVGQEGDERRILGTGRGLDDSEQVLEAELSVRVLPEGIALEVEVDVARGGSGIAANGAGSNTSKVTGATCGAEAAGSAASSSARGCSASIWATWSRAWACSTASVADAIPSGRSCSPVDGARPAAKVAVASSSMVVIPTAARRARWVMRRPATSSTSREASTSDWQTGHRPQAYTVGSRQRVGSSAEARAAMSCSRWLRRSWTTGTMSGRLCEDREPSPRRRWPVSATAIPAEAARSW